jgi:hypothetical protein
MRFGLAVFSAVVFALLIGAFRVDADNPPGNEEGGPKPNPVCHLDALGGNNLTFAVGETYAKLFPDHCIWEISQTGKGEAAVYELTIFHPKAASSSLRQVGPAFVQTISNYKLLVKANGEVIREQQHPLHPNLVPDAVKTAFETWRQPFPGKDLLVEWWAYQEEGQERLYVGRVDVNAIQSYHAILKADGTIAKQFARLKE